MLTLVRFQGCNFAWVQAKLRACHLLLSCQMKSLVPANPGSAASVAVAVPDACLSGNDAATVRMPQGPSATLEDVARLEVEIWLDPASKDQRSAKARQVHSDLLNYTRTLGAPTGATSSKKRINTRIRSQVAARINEVAQAVLNSAVSALSIVQDPSLVYSVEVPPLEGTDDDNGDDTYGGNEGGTVTGGFLDATFGDPLTALQKTLSIRERGAGEQLSALRAANAAFSMEKADWAVGSADLWADALSTLLAVEGEAESPLVLPVREELALQGRNGKKKSMAELQVVVRSKAVRQRRVARARSKAASSGVADDLRGMFDDVSQCLQFSKEGSLPIPVVIPHSIAADEWAEVASGYENLWATLPVLGAWTIAGARREVAIDAWDCVDECSLAFRVLAGWIRALGAFETPSLRCELCYRHRATKRRCRQHSATAHITPEVRLAQVVYPLYARQIAQVARKYARDGSASGLLRVGDLDWQAVACEPAALRVPLVVRRQASILALQLRRLRPAFGREMQSEVAKVFRALLKLAINVSDGDVSGLQSYLTFPVGRKRAQALLTLRCFMIVWWATGTPWPRSFPGLRGHGHDPNHPLTHNAALVPRQLTADLARQRAWNEAVAEHKKRTEITDEWLQARKAEKLSNDAIAALIGCSQETVRKWLRNGVPSTRQRPRVKLYSATSRKAKRSKNAARI